MSKTFREQVQEKVVEYLADLDNGTETTWWGYDTVVDVESFLKDVTKLHEEEVRRIIGEDEKSRSSAFNNVDVRNDLRARQRANLNDSNEGS